MPNWKKVITSGSNAELNNINSSGTITGTHKGVGSGAANKVFFEGDGGPAKLASKDQSTTYLNFGQDSLGIVANGEDTFNVLSNGVVRVGTTGESHGTKALQVHGDISCSGNIHLEPGNLNQTVFITTGSAGTDTIRFGIGTAKGEIPATALTVSGSISSSGFVSASSFSGDGSGLTNVSATVSPAGSDTQVQFNDGGSLGGDSGLVYNKTSDTLTTTNIGAFNLTGKLTAGSTEIEGSAFDINGGVIDQTTIGGSTAAAGTFTLLTGTNITASGNISASGTIEANGNISTNAIINAPEGVFTDNIEINKTAIPKLQLKDGTNDRKLVIQVANTVTDFINNDNAAHDLRFKLHGEDNHLYLEAQNNRVGIGDNAPNQKLGIKGANAQISIEEDDTEFLRLGVGETENDAIIGYHDDNFLRFGVYSSPTDTSIDTHMSIGPTGHITASNNISSSGTITTDKFKANLEAGVDNSVLIKDADGFIKTDEIDDRVWSSGQLLSGDGGALSDGYIPYTSDGDGGLLDTSNLYWDSNKLGIGGGAVTPPKTLTVTGDISSSGAINTLSHITSSGVISASGGFVGDGSNITGITATADADSISGSFGNQRVGTTDNVKFNNITASGNISASVTIKALQFNANEGLGVTGVGYNIGGQTQLTTADSNATLNLGVNNDLTKIQYGKQSPAHNFTGNITASGNISASGNVHGHIFKSLGQNVALLNSDQMRFGNTTNETKIFADNEIILGNNTEVTGHITASGNIKLGGNLELTGSGNILGSGSYVTLRNDTAKPSELRLNCEANSHYIGIRGPVHSGASSYVLKLPNTAPSDNQILKVNGSPSGGEVTLAWESDGGGGGVSFPTTEVVSSSNALFIGKTDGAFISASTGKVEISGSGRGQLEVDYRLFDTGSTHLSTAGGAQGDIVKFGGSSTTAGDIYYLQPAGTWAQARANAGGTSTGSVAVALGTNSTTDGMLLKGMVKLDNDPSTTIGNVVFLDDTTAGHARSDAPDTSGDIVRIVGHYYSGSGLIYFNPDNTFIEVA